MKGERMLETAASRRQIRARMVVSLIAVAVSAVTLISWVLRVASMLRGGGRYDFSTYYAAAWALRHDIHANIYDASALAQAGAAAHTFVGPPLPYTYPPLFAILLSPFTVLPFKTLAALWLALNCALWLTVALVLAREIALLLTGRIHLSDGDTAHKRTLTGVLANPIPLVALALALLLCLSGEPAIQTVLTGQINLLVLLPLALGPELERRGHLRWVGAMIAVAAMLKFTPAILLLYFALRRRWQAAFAGLAVLAALMLFCVVVGPGVALASVGQALHVGTSDASLGHNEALLGPLVSALGATVPGAQPLFQALEAVVLIALALAVGFVLWRRWRPSGVAVADQEKDAAGYGVALCVMVILWPTVWVHHYVWVLPAAAVALALAILWIPRHRGFWQIAIPLFAALCCYLLVVTLPFQWDTTAAPAVTTYLGLPLRPLLLSLRALGTLGILGLLCYWYLAPATMDATSSPASRDMLERPGRSGG